VPSAASLREHLLHDVLGVCFVIHNPKHEGINSPRVAIVQTACGLAVARRQSAEVLAVFPLSFGGLEPKPRQ
jgi:hypothetical protein